MAFSEARGWTSETSITFVNIYGVTLAFFSCGGKLWISEKTLRTSQTLRFEFHVRLFFYMYLRLLPNFCLSKLVASFRLGDVINLGLPVESHSAAVSFQGSKRLSYIILLPFYKMAQKHHFFLSQVYANPMKFQIAFVTRTERLKSSC